MSNKSEGSNYELYIAKKSYDMGFFAHLLQGSKAGQPFDLVIARNEKAAFIDCKVCHERNFPLKRIEPNQHSAFQLLQKFGCTRSYIVCGFDFEGVVKGSGQKYRDMFIPYSYAQKALAHGDKSMPFEMWFDLDIMFGNLILGSQNEKAVIKKVQY